jgi:type IV fimbrial biogenesis protein FimT
MDRSRHGGFTLMELMITLALAGVLVALAVPSMREFARNSRLTSAANEMLHSLSLARTEAIKRQSGRVTVCATTDPNASDATLSCSYGAMSGWIVFVDADSNGQFDNGTDTVLGRGAANSAVTVRNDHDGIVCFNQTGFQPVDCGGQTPMQHIVLCDSRGNAALGNDSTARTLVITPTGRARVSRLHADVTTSLTAIGGSCP